MSNNIDAKARLGGHLFGDIGGESEANALTDIAVPYIKLAADSMASDTTAAVPIWTNPFDFSVQLIGVTITPISTLTASATTYATITFGTSDGAAGEVTAAAVFTTKLVAGGGTGDWVALTKITGATLTAAACVIPAGGSLHFAIAKASTGVAVPISSYCVRLRRI